MSGYGMNMTFGSLIDVLELFKNQLFCCRALAHSSHLAQQLQLSKHVALWSKLVLDK